MNRRAVRLPDYDYSQCGAYFVTVCSRNREPLFWENPGEDGAPVGADNIRPYGLHDHRRHEALGKPALRPPPVAEIFL